MKPTRSQYKSLLWHRRRVFCRWIFAYSCFKFGNVG